MILRSIRELIKKSLPEPMLEKIRIMLNRYSLKSYSQEGEDLILRRIFEYKDKGFYVDVGAHHPFRFSNNSNLALEYSNLANYKIIDTQEIQVIPLNEIFNTYLPKDQEIDFMNIDTEGFDFEVLQSNDWTKYRPTVVLVEIIPANTIEELMKNPIYSFMFTIGYELLAKCFNTSMFIDKHKKEKIMGATE